MSYVRVQVNLSTVTLIIAITLLAIGTIPPGLWLFLLFIPAIYPITFSLNIRR